MYSRIQEASVASRGAQQMGVEEEKGSCLLSERRNRGASNESELISFLLHHAHIAAHGSEHRSHEAYFIVSQMILEGGQELLLEKSMTTLLSFLIALYGSNLS